MPNKDWYWDRFDVDVIDQQLDLSDDQTSALGEKGIEGRADYTDDYRLQYETDWIDQLYGTEQRAWETNKGESLEGREPTQGMYSTDSWQVNDALMHDTDFDPTWGLDLVRDWTGKEDLKVGTPEHFHWQTRGTVDWAYYYNDNAYQKAWKEYRKDLSGQVKTMDLEDYLTSDKTTQGRTAGSDISVAGKIDFLDYAKTYTDTSDNTSKDLRDTWANQYVDQFDPETAPAYSPTYLDVPNLWEQAEAGADWETPLTPISVVKPPTIPNLGDFKRTQVEVPDSIKHFGEAKSAPTESFTAGGQPSGGSPPPPTTQGGD